MNIKKLSEYNLHLYLNESDLLKSITETKIWFAHLNLNNLNEIDIPDSGQITDYFCTEIEFPEIDLFLLLINKKIKETWTDSTKYVYFQELIEIKFDNDTHRKQNVFVKKRGCVWKKQLNRDKFLKIISQNPTEPLYSVAKNRNVSIVQTDQPFKLGFIKIPKPWGYETWYTGVEKRGVVNVFDDFGKTELPYSLSLFKTQLLSDYPIDLILLKKLNPVAENVVGDLYFELHEKKWEVYVVTEIDKTAWPAGTGIIKAGINPKKISEYKKLYGDDWSKFLINNFKDVIKKYEILRRKIDSAGKHISKKVLSEESVLREKAASFVGDCYVKEGDIVSFPVFHIHSLQHGIKVIEFQTPHYERLIVMFGQKLHTQDHWDFEKALDRIILEVYKPPPLKTLVKSKGFLMERFVDFPHFTADRMFLEPKKIFEDQLNGRYHILIIISGQATVITESGLHNVFKLEEAAFIPISMGSYSLSNNGNTPLICLKAMPK